MAGRNGKFGKGALEDVFSGLLNLVRMPGAARRSAREHLHAGELLAREAMRQQRRKMRRQFRGYGGTAREKAGRNRYIRDRSRKFLKAYREAVHRDPRFQIDVSLMDAKFRPCPILDTLVPGREATWKTTLQRRASGPMPAVDLSNFSFLDDPASVLQGLKEIADVECTSISARLNFKDLHCQDAGAYLVLAEVWPQLARVFVGGEMQGQLQKVLSATGVSEHNNMLMPATIEAKASGQPAHAGIRAYPLQRRRPANSSTSQTQHLDSQAREKAADRFSNWINECLGESGEMELTIEGKAQIAAILGEALCNAERHSEPNSDDGGWSITAFMEKLEDEDGKSAYQCSVAFLSVGQSISESLSTAAEDVRDLLNKYLANHWQCGRSPESLATVLALQDTITCDPVARAERSGGTGLQDILDFVSIIGAAAEPERSPRVTIVSGRSCIRLREPYIRGCRQGGQSTKPRLLWFNEENSMEQPPDSDYVFDLPDRLAGTLVTISFRIDHAFLARQLEKEQNGVH